MAKLRSALLYTSHSQIHNKKASQNLNVRLGLNHFERINKHGQEMRRRLHGRIITTHIVLHVDRDFSMA